MIPGWGVAEEAKWLIDNPDFDERPASMPEFLGEGYMEIDRYVRPGVRKILVDIFGEVPNGQNPSNYGKAMFTGGIGVGKMLHFDNKVLTPRGWRRAGDIKVGDYLVGSNGHPTKVLRLFRPGAKPFYRMHFKDGSYADSCEDHMWAVDEVWSRGIPGTGRTEKCLRRHIWDTKTIASQNLKKGSPGHQHYRFRVPIADAVEFEPMGSVPIPAYTMGSLLANGCMTRPTITLSTDDLEIGNIVEGEISPVFSGVNLVRQKDGRQWAFTRGLGRGNSGTGNPLLAAVKGLNLYGVKSHDKFIPEVYMRASIQDRWKLLRGLMDNDGSLYGRNSSSYSTSSRQLALDVQELARSLGGYASVTSFDRRDVTEYQVHLNMDQECPFSLPRKVDKWKPRTGQPPARSIVDIEEIDPSDGVCFQVDAEDSLFIMDQYVLTHNSTFAAISMAYLAHWALCLRDPQEFFNLMPGSRISFMMMSTSTNNARGVIFDDIKGRVVNSPWFKNNYPYDESWERQIRFPQKDIYLLPGGSNETQFEGYNILGGILDEMDSHKAPKGGKDYADQGYDTIINRIQSRYGDRGLIMPIGQMKKSGGFAARKFDELKNDPDAYTARLTIWDSFGMDYEKYKDANGDPDTFYFDKMRNLVLPDDYFAAYGAKPGGNILVIPKLYLGAFKQNPVKALRDLAGIPPASEAPFISMTDRIMSCRERWVEDEYGDPSDMTSVTPPVSDSPDRPLIDPSVVAVDSIPRVVHVDQAFSGARESDAAGIAMGHISKMVDQDGEMKPYIHFDLLMRVKARPGSEIMLQDLREVLYTLRDDRGFKIRMVTFDSFQSQSSVQILRKRRFKTEILSVDKEKAPYEDLRDAIYEERLSFPPYLTHLNVGDTERVEIAVKELSELTDTGMKIDHPASGSKDLSDSMAAVVYTLIGDKKYRRSVASKGKSDENATPKRMQTPESLLKGFDVNRGRGPATRPAQMPGGLIPDSSSIQIPPHLRA